MGFGLRFQHMVSWLGYHWISGEAAISGRFIWWRWPFRNPLESNDCINRNYSFNQHFQLLRQAADSSSCSPFLRSWQAQLQFSQHCRGTSSEPCSVPAEVLSNPHASLEVEPVTHLTDELGPREEYGNSGELFLLFFISTTLQADFPGWNFTSFFSPAFYMNAFFVARVSAEVTSCPSWWFLRT